MNLYLLGGIAFFIIGIYFTISQVKKFRQHQQDELGFDMGLLIMAIASIIGGLMTIAKFL